MTLKKNLRNILRKDGQATLEYFILFLVATLAIIATNFLWFSWSGSQAEAQGRTRGIAEDYFNNMTQEILE